MGWKGEEVQVYPAPSRWHPVNACSGQVYGARTAPRRLPAVTGARQILVENADKTENWYDHLHECAMSPGSVPVTLEEAGQAIRRWRDSKGMTLEDARDKTGLGLNILSYLERAARKPQKKTIAALEAGFGWSDGFFLRLAAAEGGPEVLDQMLKAEDGRRAVVKAAPPVWAAGETDVLESYAAAYRETLEGLIAALPEEGSPRYQHTLRAALVQCAKAETLVVSSWHAVALVDRAAAHRFLRMLTDLEATRRELLERVPTSTAARLEAACRATQLPDTVICGLLGLTGDQLWQARTDGVIPDGSNARVAAFMKAVQTDGP